MGANKVLEQVVSHVSRANTEKAYEGLKTPQSLMQLGGTVLLHNGTIRTIIEKNFDVIKYKKYTPKSLFNYPVDSMIAGIYRLQETGSIISCNLNAIACKLFVSSSDGVLCAIKMLHECQPVLIILVLLRLLTPFWKKNCLWKIWRAHIIFNFISISLVQFLRFMSLSMR